MEKTHTIVYKGSFLHFPKVQISLFLKLYTQVSVVLQEHHLFHTGSAVLSLQTLTQNQNISANFKQFLHKMPMNAQGLRYQPFSKTNLEKKNNIYI